MENDINIKKKKIVSATILVIIVVGLIWFVPKYKNGSSIATTTPIMKGTDSPNQSQSKPDSGLIGQDLPFSNTPKDVVWTLFQKYLAYNKAQNLDGVKSVVYKISPVCENPETLIDCKARMGKAYQYGSELKKEDFVNVWSDEKQIILSTNFWTESLVELDQYGRFRSIIFFVKGDDNEWKLLSFSPIAGNATNKGAATQGEVDDRLIRYTEDNDQDGISDYQEECLHVVDKSTCVITSPKLRDTDGDGFWDGIETLMR